MCTTTLATLRWTKSSPGSRPTISLAGTRLSEQPIHRYSGVCWAARCWKKSGSRSVILGPGAVVLEEMIQAAHVYRMMTAQGWISITS